MCLRQSIYYITVLLILSSCVGLETQSLPTLVQYPTETPVPENSVNTDIDEVTATENSESLSPNSDPAVLLYADSELAFLYSCPALDCNILAQLETGQAILVIAVDESWYESISETYVGYILAEYLSQFPPNNVNVVVANTATAIPSQNPESSSSTPTNTPPPTQTNETTNNTVSVPGTSVQNTGNNNNGSSSQNTGNNNNSTSSQNTNNNNSTSSGGLTPTNTSRPVSPTPPWTPSATPTSTATLSFDDLPDVPDTVLTPIIIADPGLPVVITVTVDADTALPTISAFPTDALPGG